MPQPEMIAECWEAFARRFMPEEPSEFQVRDMRRCFYNGAWDDARTDDDAPERGPGSRRRATRQPAARTAGVSASHGD